jgi:hypothetical protein
MRNFRMSGHRLRGKSRQHGIQFVTESITLRYREVPPRYVSVPEGAHTPADEVVRLPDGCEVFELRARNAEEAEALFLAVTGEGGLGGVHHSTRHERLVLLEYIGDLFLLFDFIDSLGFPVERRALVPLSDSSLIAIACTVWHDDSLREDRILERAAGSVSNTRQAPTR